MKLSDLKREIPNYQSVYKFTDLENFFNIYEKDNNYVYNLNSTLYLNIDESALQTYILKSDMFWPLISYKLYETTHLAWLLMKINNVQAKDIFNKLPASTKIKYVDTNTIQSIISQSFN